MCNAASISEKIKKKINEINKFKSKFRKNVGRGGGGW